MMYRLEFMKKMALLYSCKATLIFGLNFGKNYPVFYGIIVRIGSHISLQKNARTDGKGNTAESNRLLLYAKLTFL